VDDVVDVFGVERDGVRGGASPVGPVACWKKRGERRASRTREDG
jgi:hypothetical protein